MEYDEKYYTYLDGLRESGETNMYGARSYLMDNFPELEDDKKLANHILTDWMGTFGDRHQEGEDN